VFNSFRGNAPAVSNRPFREDFPGARLGFHPVATAA
jgi:hypothetical protein